MFGFLKDKLKSVVSSFSKKVAEESKDVDEPKEPPKEPPKKQAAPAPKKEPDKKPEPKKEEKKPEKKEERKEQKKEDAPKHEEKEPKKEEKKPEHKKEEKKPEPKREEKKHEESRHHAHEKEEKKEHHAHEELKKDITAPEVVVEKAPLGTIKDDTKLKELARQEMLKKDAAKAAKETPPPSGNKQETHAPEKKKGFFERIFGHKEEKPLEHTPEQKPVEKKPIEKQLEEKPVESKPQPPVEKQDVPKEESKKEPEPPAEEHKKGFFEALKEKITHKQLSEEKFEELFWDLEVAMLENNVAVEVIDKIKTDMKKGIVGVPIKKNEIDHVILRSLKRSIEELFDVPGIDLVDKIAGKKPFVILFLGINGAGKTTTIAKFAHMLQELGFKVVMAAGDTFRAAAIQQLEQHATNLKIKIIKHDYGSDSAAVAFDAVAYAKAKDMDVVLIDTAGRLHSNTNLMDELKKIVRVSQPDLKIFIGESITGNDCVEQAKQFNAAIGIDGIILSKADVDEKGGAAISVSYVTGRPILYLGVGQTYADLKEFKPEVIIESLGLGEV